MSSVWLTASAVRYMICRLLRARASQGLAAALEVEVQQLAAFLLAHRADDVRAVGHQPPGAATMSILSDRSSGVFSAGSVNSISVPPSCTWSPLLSCCSFSTRWPLTNVPLELSRSTIDADAAVVAELGVAA